MFFMTLSIFLLTLKFPHSEIGKLNRKVWFKNFLVSAAIGLVIGIFLGSSTIPGTDFFPDPDGLDKAVTKFIIFLSGLLGGGITIFPLVWIISLLLNRVKPSNENS